MNNKYQFFGKLSSKINKTLPSLYTTSFTRHHFLHYTLYSLDTLLTRHFTHLSDNNNFVLLSLDLYDSR